MERIITEIHMTNNFKGDIDVYRIGEMLNNSLQVRSIIYKRDGLQNINHRATTESGYLVTLLNELNKEAVYRVIPSNFVQEIAFIEVEQKKENDIKVEKI